jgi:hypothetical protein
MLNTLEKMQVARMVKWIEDLRDAQTNLAAHEKRVQATLRSFIMQHKPSEMPDDLRQRIIKAAL